MVWMTIGVSFFIPHDFPVFATEDTEITEKPSVFLCILGGFA